MGSRVPGALVDILAAETICNDPTEVLDRGNEEDVLCHCPPASTAAVIAEGESP